MENSGKFLAKSFYETRVTCSHFLLHVVVDSHILPNPQLLVPMFHSAVENHLLSEPVWVSLRIASNGGVVLKRSCKSYTYTAC